MASDFLHMDCISNNFRMVKLQINLEHINCMSRFKFGDFHELKMSTINSIPIEGHNYLFTIQDYYGVNNDNKMGVIIRNLKNNSSMYAIKNWYLNKNTLRVSYIEKLLDSPFGLLNSYDILKYRESSQNGVDTILMTIFKMNEEEALKRLNLLGDITIKAREEIDETGIGFNFPLSEMELKVFKKALDMNYFESPKQSHLKDIANEMNISTVAANNYIRTAQKKIIMNEFKSFYD